MYHGIVRDGVRSDIPGAGDLADDGFAAVDDSNSHSDTLSILSVQAKYRDALASELTDPTPVASIDGDATGTRRKGKSNYHVFVIIKTHVTVTISALCIISLKESGYFTKKSLCKSVNDVVI